MPRMRSIFNKEAFGNIRDGEPQFTTSRLLLMQAPRRLAVVNRLRANIMRPAHKSGVAPSAYHTWQNHGEVLSSD